MTEALFDIHAVLGIIMMEEKILVSQRQRGKTYAGLFEFPGGKIEKDESSAAALQRELQEELGITVLLANFLFHHTHIYSDQSVLLDIWKVETFSGEVYARENQLLKWVTGKELTQLPMLSGNQFIINKLLDAHSLDHFSPCGSV